MGPFISFRHDGASISFHLHPICLTKTSTDSKNTCSLSSLSSSYSIDTTRTQHVFVIGTERIHPMLVPVSQYMIRLPLS